MGYDLLAAIAFAFLAPLVVLGFVVFWYLTHRARNALETVWESYATSRGIGFEAASGDWPNRTSPALTWSNDHASFRLVVMGRESTAFTRLVVKPRSVLLGECVVVVRDAATIELRGSATRLFDEPLKRALLAFRNYQAVSLAYRRARVTVEWRGREVDERRLDEARVLGDEIARAVERCFLQRAA